MIELIVMVIVLLAFVGFAFYLHYRDKNDRQVMQKAMDGVKILEFSCGFDVPTKSYARAKVIWEGQDFPVEFIRDKYSCTYIAHPKGDIERYGSWKSVDDFSLYFSLPRHVQIVLDDRFEQEEEASEAIRKQEYLSKKMAENNNPEQ